MFTPFSGKDFQQNDSFLKMLLLYMNKEWMY